MGDSRTGAVHLTDTHWDPVAGAQSIAVSVPIVDADPARVAGVLRLLINVDDIPVSGPGQSGHAGEVIVAKRDGAPLVPREGWHVEGGFFENWTPDAWHMHSSILRSPEVRFFRSYSPETGPTSGTIATDPFPLPRYLGIPVSGTPYAQEISVFVECLASGARMPVATGHLQQSAVEQILVIPPAWCPSNARLMGETTSEKELLYLGTPFAASWLAYMKGSAPVLLFSQAFVLVPLALIACAIAIQFLCWGWERELAILGAGVGVCLYGYVNFYVGYLSPEFQKIISLITIPVAAAFLIRRRDIAWQALRHEDVSRPLAVFLLVSASAILAVYAIETGSGSWSPNYRFAPALWSSDNQLQPMVAELLYRGKSVLNWHSLWQTSDRPPLLSGVLLLSRPWWEPILAVNENRRLLDLFYQCTAISLIAFWVVPVWYFIRQLELAHWRESCLFILFAATPFTFFNTIYTWPKLLSAWLALIAYWLIIQRRLTTGSRIETRVLILGGTAATLALLSHGGVVFGLLPVALLMLTRRFWPGWRPLLMGALVSAALLTPWVAWQKLVDPPGNHLTKSAFAGTYGEGENHISLRETIRRRYERTSLDEWVKLRLKAMEYFLRGLLVPPAHTRWGGEDTLDRMRYSDLMFVGTSMRVLNVGWLFLLVSLLAFPRCLATPTVRTALLMAGLGLSGFILMSLTTFLEPVISHYSYLSIVLLALSLATVICSQGSRPLIAGVVLIQLTYMVVVWGIAPLDLSVSTRMDAIAAWAATVVLTGERILGTAGELGGD